MFFVVSPSELFCQSFNLTHSILQLAWVWSFYGVQIWVVHNAITVRPWREISFGYDFIPHHPFDEKVCVCSGLKVSCVHELFDLDSSADWFAFNVGDDVCSAQVSFFLLRHWPVIHRYCLR